MPRIKNTFLKGKMNQDLDDRLLPNGEYREAVNLNITKSDAADVGALQSIPSSLRIDTGESTLSVLGNPSNIKVIGFFVDKTKNNFFTFVTNFTDDGQGGRPTSSDTCAILTQGENDTQPKILAQGEFLNFSKNHEIRAVNIIEDLLFFTDAYNQPRKINVQTALDDSSHYDSEDKISVAKYYPYNAPRLIKKITTFLNANTTITTSATQDIVLDYTNASTFAVDSNTELRFTIGTPVVEYKAEVTSVTDNGSTFTVSLGQVKLASDGSSITTNKSLTTTDELVFTSNYSSMIESQSSDTDKDFLKERFVKFAYRFKFSDGEYSLISPFSQTCFIPEFYKPSSAGNPFNATGGISLSEELDAVRSTELEKMVNYVSELELFIDLPFAEKDLTSKLDITEIEIIFQESLNSALRTTTPKSISATQKSNVFTYNYNSKLPYKVLPESETVRVFDNVPVSAFTQEIVGNRLVYGNITLGHNVPSVSYSVSTQERTSSEFDLPKEYPTQSLKQNRSYQVGIVLADRYGRQSSVLLPKTGNDTIFLEQKSHLGDDVPNGYDDGDGFCLSINFTENIDPSKLYSATNPLGWYSYKVVVKQAEQDYYNVYAPPLIKDFPTTNNKTWLTLIGDNINKVPRSLETGVDENTLLSPSKAVLTPKVLNTSSGVSPSITHSNNGDVSAFTFGDVKVISIGKQSDHKLVDSSDVNKTAFYESDKNNLLAEIKNSYGVDYTDFTEPMSIVTSSSNPETADEAQLSVMETKPFQTALEIYYETSTSGLISELNEDISEGSGIADIVLVNNSFAESETGFTDVEFSPRNASNTAIDPDSLTAVITTQTSPPSTITYLSVELDSNDNKYKLKVNTPQYYNSGGLSKRYNVAVTATEGSDSRTETFEVLLENVDVVFDSTTAEHFRDNAVPDNARISGYQQEAPLQVNSFLVKMKADNGTALTASKNSNISYIVNSVNYSQTLNGSQTDITSQNRIVLKNNDELHTGLEGISAVGFYHVEITAKDTAIGDTGDYIGSSGTVSAPDTETTTWVLQATSGDTNNYFFVNKVLDDGNITTNNDVYHGWDSKYNSAYDTDESHSCWESGSVGTHQLQIGWNSSLDSVLDNVVTSNCFGGASGVFQQNLILPAKTGNTNDNIDLKFFETHTEYGTNNLIHMWALKSKESQSMHLLRLREIAVDDEETSSDDTASFSNVQFWITNDTDLVNSLKNGSKRIQITLTRKGFGSSSDTDHIVNLKSSTPSTSPYDLSTEVNIKIDDNYAYSNGYGNDTVTNGSRVLIQRWYVDSSNTAVDIENIISNAAEYQDGDTPNPAHAVYSSYIPNAFTLLGEDSYGDSKDVLYKSSKNNVFKLTAQIVDA